MFRFIPFVFVIFSLAGFNSSCSAKKTIYNENIPPIILWAWEREEDMRFIDSSRIGVGYLAQTLIPQTDEVLIKPRRQPLQINEDTYLIAVTRIETNKQMRPTYSTKQQSEIVELILKTLQKKSVKAIQIDFDVVVSERDFYRRLLNELRPKMEKDIPLTITALASYCVGDVWFGDLPIDESVPMIFRMGADAERVKNFISSGRDFNEPLCQTSYGFSLDEPMNIDLKANRRVYIFNNRSWKAEDLGKVYEIAQQK
jgi:hypothetical protein